MKTFMFIVVMIFSAATFAAGNNQQIQPVGINLAATTIYFGVGDRHYDRYDRYDWRYDRHHRSHRCYVKRCWKKHGYVKCRYYQTRCRYRY